MSDQKFFMAADAVATQPEPGVTRRVLAHSPGMMLVQIDFETGAAGSVHAHPHEQMTYILSGRFRFDNGGEVREVAAGDSIRFAPDVVHGAVCIEAGRLVDVFCPCREDFL